MSTSLIAALTSSVERSAIVNSSVPPPNALVPPTTVSPSSTPRPMMTPAAGAVMRPLDRRSGRVPGRDARALHQLQLIPGRLPLIFGLLVGHAPLVEVGQRNPADRRQLLRALVIPLGVVTRDSRRGDLTAQAREAVRLGHVGHDARQHLASLHASAFAYVELLHDARDGRFHDDAALWRYDPRFFDDDAHLPAIHHTDFVVTARAAVSIGFAAPDQRMSGSDSGENERRLHETDSREGMRDGSPTLTGAGRARFHGEITAPMTSWLGDWANLLLRWTHFIAGIAWIGSSFYFIWLDRALTRPEQPKAGVEGDLWMVHSGGFYQVEKRRPGPGEV